MRIMIILSIILLASTLICGLWIGAQDAVDVSSKVFHRNIGIGSSVFTMITMIVVLVSLK